MKSIWEIGKSAAVGFSEDKLTTLSAALAYYAIFSIAPLVIISIALAGWIFGVEATTGEMYHSISGVIGEKSAESIQSMVENASQNPSSGLFATIVSIVLLLVGASGVFGQLQDSLNQIWRVQPLPGRSIAAIVYQRILSLSMVLVIAFLLLVSLMISTILAAIGEFFQGVVSVEDSWFWSSLNFSVSFMIITALFAAIFKVLPDVNIRWVDVWRGAVITSFLFTLGKYFIGLYLGRSTVASSYGAAGSLIIILLWVYYSSVILLFGAEITRAYVRYCGHDVTPKRYAEFRPELDVNKAEKAPIHESTGKKSAESSS